MTKTRRVASACALLSAAFLASASARTGKQITLQGVDVVVLETLFGSGLDIDTGGGLELFGGDLDRTEEFEKRLLESARWQLVEAGFHVVPADSAPESASEVTAWLVLSFFGRPVSPELKRGQYVYMVELDGDRPPAESRDDALAGSFWSQRAIGVAADETLESALERTATAMLAYLIRAST